MNKRRAALPRQLITVAIPSPKELAIKRKQQQEWGLGTQSGKYANHVYQVFNDRDFDSAIHQLRNKIEGLYYKNISLCTDAHDEHLLLEDKQLIKELADLYCITLDDLGNYADGYFENGYEFGKDMAEFGGILTGTSDYLLNYVIGPKTSLEQIINDWPLLKELRELLSATGKVNSKSKSPAYPDLIYSIFKARNFNKEQFSSIYKNYEHKKLGNTSNRQFNSEDSLERYYRKYAPNKKLNRIKIIQ